ncbi:MAG: FAD-dependent oxidoreductase [Saprospiraceae bacterium]|nr:FAD-dependent oxidoreductase [Saprospiraceae bacterium]MDW8228321.1 FAD-dependent oxidoreductase [Saprospiraceae bacterium]
MRAIVIGGGVIGLSAAYFLREEGWEVVVLEKGDLTNGCSFGNMGYLSPSHFEPLASPGIVKQGLWWMLRTESPFYIRPSLDWRLFDWGFKFMRAATPAHVERCARPLADLLLLSKAETKQWAESGLFDFEYTERGCVLWYNTPEGEKSEAATARRAEELGLKITVLNREQARALEPDAQMEVRGGVLYHDDAHLYPNALMQQLPRVLERRGVRVLCNSEVVGFVGSNGAIDAVCYRPVGVADAEERLPADIVVLAAGSWSPQVARLCGEYLPMMPGKGYSVTVDAPERTLRHPCILKEAKVALTPWRARLRIGSTLEIGHMDDRIRLRRVQSILRAVGQYLPGIAADPKVCALQDADVLLQRAWFGYRPLSADGMPYIGFGRRSHNLIIATGHAMLGVSLAAGTGRVVAELATGKPTSVDVTPFDPKRYS